MSEESILNNSHLSIKELENIRKAKVTDIEAINMVSEGLGYKSDDIEKEVSRVKVIIESESDNLFIYESENEIYGWIHFFHAYRVASDPFIEIGGLVVSEKHRRKGIATKLVTCAVEYAKTQRMKIRVRCSIKREEAHLFYLSLDFINKKSQHVFELKLD